MLWKEVWLHESENESIHGLSTQGLSFPHQGSGSQQSRVCIAIPLFLPFCPVPELGVLSAAKTKTADAAPVMCDPSPERGKEDEKGPQPPFKDIFQSFADI